MAILKNHLEFSGGLGNLSAYKLPGMNKTIIRTKGGADKKKILKSPSFKLTRDNYTEFSACAKMGGSIRRSMMALAPLADYNYTPMLNALAKAIQLLDTENPRGERKVFLSRHKHLLTGFSLNRNTAFESVVRNPLQFNIDPDQKEALVQFPELMPGVNLMLSKQYPLFRFIVNLGCVSDLRLIGKKYHPGNIVNKSVYTDWFRASQLFEAMEVSVKLNQRIEPSDQMTMILSLGIQMGVPVTDTIVNPVKYGGCAKIVGVA
jgi:hypothetical protein